MSFEERGGKRGEYFRKNEYYVKIYINVKENVLSGDYKLFYDYSVELCVYCSFIVRVCWVYLKVEVFISSE